jgi:hypothetical protein
MTSRLSRWLRDPLFLLCLVAGLLAFVVQSGELGTADTTHRLQTAHWLWTSQPQVFPNEYPEFGLHGRDGRLYSWYGIGQSLLMLPCDLIATWISHWHVFFEYEDDPAVRSIIVSYSTNILVNVLTAMIAFRLLRQLRFSVNETVAGVLALLFCTTHLHYTQNMQENNYIMLLTLTGFSFQYEWLRTDNGRALWIGSAALGLNLLTRITTGIDVIACGIFLLAVLWFDPVRGGDLWRRILAYCKVTAPVYAFFSAIDRIYNFYRFGTWTGTYIPIFARESRAQDPTLPWNFPWSTPFHEGVLGALFKPEKSIFLFDPLLILVLLLFVLLWKRLIPEVRAYAAASLFLLAAYISFYARYTYWAGDFSWGDRYVSTAVEMVALLAVPLLLHYRDSFSKVVWRGGLVLIGLSFVIQIASLAFWLPLEIYQMEDLGHPRFVIAMRFKNIVAFALGRMDAWGLNTDAMGYDHWDYAHITTWNFLPFLLRRVGEAPKWVVDMVFGVWLAALGALSAALLRLRSALLSVSWGDLFGS